MIVHALRDIGPAAPEAPRYLIRHPGRRQTGSKTMAEAMERQALARMSLDPGAMEDGSELGPALAGLEPRDVVGEHVTVSPWAASQELGQARMHRDAHLDGMPPRFGGH